MSSIPKLVVGLIVLGFIYTNRWSRSWDFRDTFTNNPSLVDSIEFDLMHRAYEATSDQERLRLLAELEAVPVQDYPFYHRWLLVNEIDPYACWSDTGYDSSRSDLIPELQWLEVTTLGVSQIDDGGLLQFFENDTGRFAPEMAQWFEQAGLPEAAGALRKAMAHFGADFPRSTDQRIASLQGKGDGLFFELDDALLTEVATKYDEAADRWIRDRCAIQKLSDPPPKASAK